MRRQSHSHATPEEESTIDITPMLDVVFIMLIFFIVTATFVKEAGTEVVRPDAETALRQQKANILIAVTANNEIWIDGNEIDERLVKPKIEQLRAENPQGSVVIQADKGSKTEKVMAVMEAANSVGVTNVAIATEQ